ncbi:hypothetical protein EXIGLDRAFT_829376 [Exidia glandulosa HHB12029]|uniref:Uncharacterized protein n=1 Tax=Exidia glandulosa HHB12029 TaxID=1314781 RepID=A0A165PQ40_EXIGL|nr:hypothetical protein EXIGLDRAFT_829376 [Exidia glandulosa HHB12029]
MTKTRAAQSDAIMFRDIPPYLPENIKPQRPAHSFLPQLNSPHIPLHHLLPPASMSRVAAIIALTLSTVASVSAGVILPRANDGDTSDCFTRYAGTLAASTNGTYKAFTYSTLNQTVYTGRGENPLVVQFQNCNSLNGLRGDNATTEEFLFGRLYVPHLKKCIAVTNQSKTVGPYYTTMNSCNTGYAQRFRLDQKAPGSH